MIGLFEISEMTKTSSSEILEAVQKLVDAHKLSLFIHVNSYKFLLSVRKMFIISFLEISLRIYFAAGKL